MKAASWGSGSKGLGQAFSAWALLASVGIWGRPSGGVLCIGGWLATSWISTHQKSVAPPSWVVTAKDAPGLCQMPPVSRITPSWEPQRQMWCLWPKPVYTACPSFTSSQAPPLPRWTLPDTLSKSQPPSTCVFLLNSSFFNCGKRHIT